ncbi:unnamed protein product [Oppiella nova]|uniref:Uncharacterized protein n=1 Tax=Oppiella nova TaxID=334625 RepID=A0A7R9MIY8_9ACAR|nr:unnamed protein product [Oppiella nova]CAG2177826.1 unnamed protein product [Oppiella nova]
MSLKDILDALFGDHQNKHPFNGHLSPPFNDEPKDNPFNDIDSQMNRQFVEMSSFMTQMLNRFSVINGPNEWPSIESQESKNARDLMMKSSEDKPALDTDLDQSVGRNGLDVILNSSTRERRSPPQTNSLTRVYVYSSVNNNGRIEEQKRCEDGFGNSETSITRRIGDKFVTEVIKRDKNNEIIETNEVINNLDQEDLNQFKAEFKRMESIDGNEVEGQHRLDNYSPPNSFLRRLFEFPFRLY